MSGKETESISLPISEWQETINNIRQTCQGITFDEGASCSTADVELAIACFIHEQIPQAEIRNVLLALWNGEETTQAQYATSVQVVNATNILSTIQIAVSNLASGDPSEFNEEIVGRLICLYDSHAFANQSFPYAEANIAATLHAINTYFYIYLKSVSIFAPLMRQTHRSLDSFHDVLDNTQHYGIYELFIRTIDRIHWISDSTRQLLRSIWIKPNKFRYPSAAPKINEIEFILGTLVPLCTAVDAIKQPKDRLILLYSKLREVSDTIADSEQQSLVESNNPLIKLENLKLLRQSYEDLIYILS